MSVQGQGRQTVFLSIWHLFELNDFRSQLTQLFPSLLQRLSSLKKQHTKKNMIISLIRWADNHVILEPFAPVTRSAPTHNRGFMWRSSWPPKTTTNSIDTLTINIPGDFSCTYRTWCDYWCNLLITRNWSEAREREKRCRFSFCRNPLRAINCSLTQTFFFLFALIQASEVKRKKQWFDVFCSCEAGQMQDLRLGDAVAVAKLLKPHRVRVMLRWLFNILFLKMEHATTTRHIGAGRSLFVSHVSKRGRDDTQNEMKN